MRGVAKIRTFRLNLEAYKRDVEKAMTAELKKAVRAYLRAIIFKVIPVWSGASVATFIKLATIAEQPLVISPVVRSRIALGAAMSDAQLIVDLGKGEVKARYTTSLPHLIFNEFNNANAFGLKLRQPGPYEFQEKGAEAFRAVAEKARLPNPFKRLK